MKYKNLCLTALFAALLCVLSPLTVPIGPIPLSLATFVIYITSICIGRRSALSVLVFVLLGAIGIPVFSGFCGGAQMLTGLTGGYIIGYIPCAFVIGYVSDRMQRKPLPLLLSMLAGTVVLYAVGTLQYMWLSKNPLLPSLAVCVFPFLPGDSIKIAAALLLSFRLKKIRLFQG